MRVMNSVRCRGSASWLIAGAVLVVGLGAGVPVFGQTVELRAEKIVIGDEPDDGTVQVEVIRDRNGMMVVTINGTEMSARNRPEAEQLAKRAFGQHTVEFVNPQRHVLWTMPRVLIGVYTVPVRGALASQMRLQDDEAILVTEVVDGLPAARAGLRRFDIIIQCNNERPITTQSFSRMLARAEPGERMNWEILWKMV